MSAAGGFAGAARLIGAADAISGLALVARPGQVVAVVTGRRGQVATPVVRVLGAREVLQGALLVIVPRRRVVTLCAAADFAHAASMYVLAALRPTSRRAAAASALAATATGTLTVIVARGLR